MSEKKSHGRSKAGVELTDDALERLAAEAEAGLDVAKLRRRRGRPAMGSGPAETVPVRLDPELRGAVEDQAEAEDATVSDVVREALRRYLNDAHRIEGRQGAERAKEPLMRAEFKVYKDRGGEYRWRLHASNYTVLADSSEGYTSKSACIAAIDVVRQVLESAEINDLTDSRI